MFRSAAIAVAILAAGSAAAQTPAAPTVVRGKVAALNGTALSVKTDKGPVQAITLTPNWVVSVTKPVPIDAIKPGSFIGASNMPTKDGRGRALEVHVFPPGVKMGEGHYGWDLKKGSMMTNGTVGTVVSGKRGSRELEVSYSTGKRSITVPANAPIVQIVPGGRDLVKVGTPVFLVVNKRPDGTLMAGGVSVGENGAKPPM